MNIPTQVKPALWGAVGGAVVAIVVGFSWGNWVTGGTAQQMAKATADAAVVTALAPICVDKFQTQPDAAAQLIALKAISSYQQSTFVEKGGWATMAGSEKPHSGTAKVCAEMLAKLAAQ